MANQIVQLGRRVLNANRVSSSVNFFRSPNRFDYRHISRLFKPFRKGAFDKEALAQEEHKKMEHGKVLCEIRDIINELNNNLDNLDQEELVSEREIKTNDNDIAKLSRERWDDMFNERLANDPLYSDLYMRSLSWRIRNELAIQNAETTNLNNKLDQGTTDDAVYNAVYNGIRKLGWKLRDIINELINLNNTVDQEEQQHQKMKLEKLCFELRDIINEFNNNLDQGMTDDAVYNALRKFGWKLRDILKEIINLNNTVDQEEQQHQKMKLGKLWFELRDIINELNNNLDQEELVSEREVKTTDNEIAKLHRERWDDMFNERLANDPLYSDLYMRSLSWRICNELAIQNAETTNLNNKHDQGTTDDAVYNAVYNAIRKLGWKRRCIS